MFVMEVVRRCYLLERQLTGFAIVLSLRWTPIKKLPFSEMGEDLKRSKFACGYRKESKLNSEYMLFGVSVRC